MTWRTPWLIVATVIGYQTRSRAVSTYDVSQKKSGSVLTTLIIGTWIGAIVPSAWARISSGRRPPCRSSKRSQPGL